MLRLGELCAGYGGLGLALELAGIETELAWYSEHDPSNSKQPAARIMAHHHPGVPNLGDLRDITDPPPVDIVTAGFPCQPVSAAGQRAGVGDDRWLIRDVVAVWRRTGARWLILENVSGLRSANDGEAFGQVIDSLAEVGASCEWAHLRASDVGACHRRERWFCVVADADGSTVGPEPVTVTGCSDTTLVRSNHTAAPHADSLGLQSERSGRLPNGHEEQRGDVDRRRSERFGGYAAAVERWERILGRQAPTPTTGQGRLNPEFVEWMQGLPAGWVTGCGLTRAEQLTVLGNGVVPQQAAAAISLLTAAETAVEAA